MKKIVAIFALLVAGSFAQAQGLSDHPNARNDRTPSGQAEHHRAAAHKHRHHRHMKKHHPRKTHHPM